MLNIRYHGVSSLLIERINMIALIQRVRQAHVEVDQETIGSIQQGLLVFLGVEKNDTLEQAQKLVHKVLHYRVFEDEQGKMNQNVQQVQGQLLIVSQFTLAADTQKGLRPSFSQAAPPEQAQHLYQEFVRLCSDQKIDLATGAFGADMQVHLVNDGPVTFSLTA
tara:strand:+ start:12488 stop:12979 length:492 start_codon:yes stop_codon:yes gene_type:complete